ncbi:MAG: CRTAC1 family protein [Planctomycetes bacterium]|nr:CRTAC1 family protein [Planctomycetota bacterium]
MRPRLAAPWPTGPAALALLLAGCTGGSSPEGSPGGGSLDVQLVERHAEAGIAFRHTDGSSGKYYIVETLASGVILFDFDQDADLDIYFANGRPLPPTPEGNASASNALYRSEGGSRFTDVTRVAKVPGTGFGSGGAAGDMDGDGDLDLYVCQYGPNVLYRNEGREAGFGFKDWTAASGADDARFSAGACFFDMDRDGDLDLYVTNYSKDGLRPSDCYEGKVLRYCAPSKYEGEADSLFRNRGDGTFEDVTASAGIVESPPGRGMGVVATDPDRDGWLDLYVANDGSENFLFKNLGGGRFEEIGMTAGVALSANGDEQGSMGVDAADFNRDGRLDILVTNYQKQLDALYRLERKLPDGRPFFSDVAMAQGLGETCLPMVSWGTKLFDLDNDGWLDIFIANGHLEDHIEEYDHSSSYLQQNQLFRNQGSGAFKEVSDVAGPGLRERFSSRGAAFGDLDSDGDIDIVVSNSRDRPSLLYNQGGNARSWVSLQLEGRRNKLGVGAFVRLTAGGVAQVAEVHCGSSYVSQNDLKLHFGLGDAAVVETVEVDWPEGTKEVFRDLPARKVHRLVEGTGEPAARS